MEADTPVGLDTGRKGIVTTAVDPWGEQIDQPSLGPAVEELVAYLRRLSGTKRAALQAGAMRELFHDAAVAAGARFVLSHPYRTRLVADASLKSDTVHSEVRDVRLQSGKAGALPGRRARATDAHPDEDGSDLEAEVERKTAEGPEHHQIGKGVTRLRIPPM